MKKDNKKLSDMLETLSWGAVPYTFAQKNFDQSPTAIMTFAEVPMGDCFIYGDEEGIVWRGRTDDWNPVIFMGKLMFLGDNETYMIDPRYQERYQKVTLGAGPEGMAKYRWIEILRPDAPRYGWGLKEFMLNPDETWNPQKAFMLYDIYCKQGLNGIKKVCDVMHSKKENKDGIWTQEGAMNFYVKCIGEKK